MINVEWSVIKDFAREKRVNEQDLFNAVRRAVTAPQALEKQIAEAASAQGGQVEETCLPPFDPNKPRDEQGLYGKFLVQRVDGSDLPGGKHHGCKYFVLDVDHDKYAAAALGTYASQCEQEYPLLAKDLREKFGAQGGQGAEVVAWSWEYRGLHVSTDKAFIEKIAADGFAVRPLVFADTQLAQQGSVPEIIKAIADKLEKVEGESADGGYMWDARECAEFIREEADKLSTTPQADGWVNLVEDLANRAESENISVEVVFDDGYTREGFDTDISEHVANWLRSIKRPQPPAGQEGSGDE